MPIFKFRAKNENNQVISGLVDAETEDEAVNILREKRYSILSLQKKSGFSLDMNLALGGVKTKDVVIFSRQFSVLISANVALVHSLKLLVDQIENVKFKQIIAEIADEVDGGARLSESLAKRPKIFSSFYVNVVKSGETSGKLDEVLNYLADELEKDYDMNAKIKGAMIYPLFVVSGLVIVGVVMMMFVVPKLVAVILESGGELPLPTRILIATSDFLLAYWYILLVALIGLGVGIKILVSKPEGKRLIDTLRLKLPIFGELYKKIYLVRFTRSMNTLIIGGVSISKSLDIAADVVSNEVYRELILETKKQVEDGNSISSVFTKSQYIPSMVSQMLSIGEKTGRLDVILSKITDFYTREINNTIANLMSLLEPIVIVLIGLGVGTMVAAIILPMYQMADSY